MFSGDDAQAPAVEVASIAPAGRRFELAKRYRASADERRVQCIEK
jgi:hypothetical protein